MRIGVIGPAYPLRGGIAHHVYCLERELTKRGHSVQVISFRKLYPRLLFPGKTEFDNSSAKLDARGERILSPLDPLTWATAFRTVKSFAPDVIIFQWWQTFFGPMVGTLARRFRKHGFRCIIECHNVFPHESTPFDRLLLKFALRPAEAYIAHSAKVKNELLQFAAGKRVSTSPLPIPSEFSSPAGHARNGRTILFFGKVRKYKGLDVLLAAMPKVLSQIKCQLIIAGEFYDSEEKYRRLIDKHGLEQHVHIDNRYIPNEEVVRLFDRADVLVMPYLSATQSSVAQIALANSLPIIASRCGGFPEIVIENVNGMLFPVGDSNTLTDRIVSYFSDNLGPIFAGNIRSAGGEPDPDLAELIEDLVRSKESAVQDPAAAPAINTN